MLIQSKQSIPNAVLDGNTRLLRCYIQLRCLQCLVPHSVRGFSWPLGTSELKVHAHLNDEIHFLDHSKEVHGQDYCTVVDR